jgi:hypothetical protein
MCRSAALRAGDWVEVRSKDQILATLDRSGRLDGLPFMPEMLGYCGKRFRVSKRAHKTCDPPSGLGGRKLTSAVHLEDLRCDGQAHGGCQAGCLLFWKEAWLVPLGQDGESLGSPRNANNASINGRAGTQGCTERDVWANTRAAGDAESAEDPRYVCQSTHLVHATRPLRSWDVRQYIEDFTSGNASAGQLLASLVYSVYSMLVDSGIGLGAALRWIYDRFQTLRGAPVYPARPGQVPPGMPTPSARLHLKPGERVRVKPYREILATLNDKSHNRGLYFDPEHVVFCGGTFEVLRCVERIIDERSGKMLHLKSDAIILKDVVCQARYARCRKMCPRAIYPYWREIWLERVPD